jgi:hypothetical protein
MSMENRSSWTGDPTGITAQRSAMTERHTQLRDQSDVGWYEIRVAGVLSENRASWFDGMTLSLGGDGTTVIRGPVADQAVLHGLLQRIRDLGIPLLSVARTSPASADPSGFSKE